jgi:hypothetical protein
MSDAPERIWALHYECEDEPDAIAIGYPEKFFGTHEYVRADHIEKLEAKLAKCSALMHAGFAEYKRRLTRAVKALELADAALSGANMNMSVVEREVKATIAELEGELDD